VRQRFKDAGFGPRECAVLVGAIASVEKAAAAAEGGLIKARVDPADEQDELFPADGGIFIPSTFGSQQAMFGSLLSTVLQDRNDIDDRKKPHTHHRVFSSTISIF
jgi:hypothetical protein